MRIARKDTVEDPAVEEEDDDGDDQRPEVAIEDPKKNKEEREGVDDAACADVDALWSRKEPDEKVRPEIGAEEYRRRQPRIEEVQYGPQEQQGDRI